MPIATNDNYQLNAPKPLDNRTGRFTAGKWRPYNDIAEFTTYNPALGWYENQIFWLRDPDDANKSILYAIDKTSTPYKVIPEVDLSDYYTKEEINGIVNPITDDVSGLEDRVSELEGSQSAPTIDVIVFTYNGTNNEQPLSFTPRHEGAFASFNQGRILNPYSEFYYDDNKIVINQDLLDNGIEYTIITQYYKDVLPPASRPPYISEPEGIAIAQNVFRSNFEMVRTEDEIIIESETEIVYSNQLFNKDVYIANSIITTSGVLATGGTATNGRVMKLEIDPSKGSGFIKATGFQHIGTVNYRWVFHDASETKLTFGEIVGEGTSRLTMPSNAKYLYLMFKHPTLDTDSAGDGLMVNYGALALPYEPYTAPVSTKYLVSINDALVVRHDEFATTQEEAETALALSQTASEDLEAFNVDKQATLNLINPADYTAGVFVNYLTGAIVPNSIYDTFNKVNVTEGQVYTGISLDSSNVFRAIAFFTETDVFVSGINGFLSTFTVPSGVNIKYVLLSVPNTAPYVRSNFGLFLGTNPTWQPYGFTYDISLVDTTKSASEKNDNNVATIGDIKALSGGGTTVSYSLSGTLLTVGTVGGDMQGQINNNNGFTGNNMFKIITPTVYGVTTDLGVDEVAPVHILNGTYGANHGAGIRRAVTGTHGLSNTDIGTLWVQGGVNYVLLRIVNATNLDFISQNSGTPESPTFTALGTGSITRGATTLSISSVSGQNMYPSIKNLVTKVYKNGAEEIPTGDSGSAKYIDVVESYEIMSIDDIINNVIARAGTSAEPSYNGIGVLKVENTYRYLPNSTMLIFVNFIALAPIKFDDFMGNQAIKIGADGQTYYYIPNSSPLQSHDFRTPINPTWTGSSSPSDFTVVSTSPDPLNPPNRVIQYYNTLGFMLGIIKTRAVGKALQNYTLRTFEIRNNTGKVYPHGIEGGKVGTTLQPGSIYSMALVRAYTDLSVTRVGNRLSYFNFDLDGVEYLYVDYSGSMLDRVDLNNGSLNGREVVVVESKNTTIITDTYNNGIYIQAIYVSGQTCFAVLQIK